MKTLLAIAVLSFILLGCGNENGAKTPGSLSKPEPTVPVNVDTLDLTGDTGSIH